MARDEARSTAPALPFPAANAVVLWNFNQAITAMNEGGTGDGGIAGRVFLARRAKKVLQYHADRRGTAPIMETTSLQEAHHALYQ